MADLSWLRFGQRSRTPTLPKAPASTDRLLAQEPEEQRRPVPSRVSSYLSLNSRFSFSPEPPTASSSTSLLVKDQDRVWHNPSLDQMVEALQVTMMTNGVLERIPLEYNSYVLHLIEGFHDLQEKLESVNAACEEAKGARAQTSEDFKTVADEWAKRESQYKAEVKRLEVLLARTSRDGLETVTLARTNSVVNRGEPDPKQFVSRLEEMRRQATPHRVDSEPNTQNDYPVFLGQPPSTTTHVLKALERIENMYQAKSEPGDKSVPRETPNILDGDKDFLTSERFRRQGAIKSNNKMRQRPRPSRLRLASKTTSPARPDSKGNSYSSSSGGDVGVAGGTSVEPGLPRAGEATGPGTNQWSSAENASPLSTDSSLDEKTSENHLCLLASDHHTAAVAKEKEIRYDRPMAPERLERGEQAARFQPHEHISTDVPSREATIDESYVAFSAAAPARPTLDNLKVGGGSKLEGEPSLSESGSAGTMDTVIRVCEGEDHVLSSSCKRTIEGTATRGDPARTDPTTKYVEETGARRVYPSPRQEVHRQNSAQIAASRALERNQLKGSGSKV
ncbi:hypothetical protein JX265_012748 [Neoarthrinium moseri]|uniref:Uncharacterized protein n=1 Tax=Neoarthrinium moseri TaxID=1658444 RepID=A0A9P9W9Y4_9PEZI|nr:hypothetical protein JX266_004992 [Neoarthrinium moseri]KAI1853457.1 hypothetical protein JX265_012748 [Neoarthrinium moseri]